MDGRWWLRPLKAVALGIAIGLAFTWLVSGLPFPENLWMMIAGAVGIIAFCIWQLIDTHRLMREHEEQMAEFKRLAGEDWPL